MEINITWNICRVCLFEETKTQAQTSSDQQPHMRNIFNDDKELAEQIYECSGVMMKPNDSLPEKICKKCFLMVKHAANFRKTCKNSDTYLRSILQRTKSASSLFKPERHNSLDFIEETLINVEKVETDHKENDVISVKSDEGLHSHKRKLSECSQEEPSSKKSQVEIEIDIKNAEDLIDHEDDVEILDSDLNNVVEIEEILDNSEHVGNSKLAQQEEKEASELQDFENQKNYRKISSDEATEDSEEIEGTNEKHNFKHDSDELYYLLKGIKEENEIETKDNQQVLETDMSEDFQECDDNVDFIPEEEEELEQQQLHLETEAEDSQAQVSSTVETKDDFGEFQNQNSNMSNYANEHATEYIIDEYLVDDSDSNIKAKNSNIVVVNKKLLTVGNQKNKKRTHVILPNRKPRFENATSSTSAGNVSPIYVCDICGNHFGNRQLMNAHMKVHRQEKNHECELCFKRFITACNLQAHMRIHTGEKPFKCQYCGRRFNDRSSHLRHERIHTNEKPYQCNDCGKSFSLSTTLKKHLKIHTGERLYRCEPCAKSFKLSHQLKAHISTSLHKAVIQLAQLQN